MAGQRLTLGDGTILYIDYADACGFAVVNGRLWRWEFHNYCGPTFLKKNGEPRECQYPTVKGVWDAFEKWLSSKDQPPASPGSHPDAPAS